MTEQRWITHAVFTDAAWISELIAKSFFDLVVAQWLVRDHTRRVEILAAEFRIWVEHAFQLVDGVPIGQVHYTADRRAVAVWFPRDPGFLEPADYQERLVAAVGGDPEILNRYQAFGTLLNEHHPTAPHDHLMALAVHPLRQGQGLGSSLLQYHLLGLDQRDRPAYLEAADLRSRKLYHKFGFGDRGNKPVLLGTVIPIHPMWRVPQRST